MKVGMVPAWDKWGQRLALTVLQVDSCQVTQVKTEAVEGHSSLQLGVGEAKVKNVSRSLLHHFKKNSIPPKRKLSEFRVTPDALLPVGATITAGHFVPGQSVDISGITKGKGFQGVMKRHGYSGQNATHGNTKAHRSMGSTGMCQDPGRVFKNKKMPGRMGGNRITTLNLWVYKVELERNLVYVKGAVPGPPGSFLRLVDGRKHKWSAESPPPFPTLSPEELEKMMSELSVNEVGKHEIVAPASKVDPFDYAELDNPFGKTMRG